MKKEQIEKMVNFIKENFTDIEAAQIYAYISAGSVYEGPRKMMKVIEAAFDNDFDVLGDVMEEAGF